MTDVFKFEHEGVDGVLVDGVAYLNSVQLGERLLEDAVSQQARATLMVTMLGPNATADEESTENTTNIVSDAIAAQGAVEQSMFLYRLALHFADVAERLAAGLPAHDGDTPDEDTMEETLAAFAAALEDMTAEDFADVPDEDSPES